MTNLLQHTRQLKGKVAIVTAAGWEIGRAIAVGYAKAGGAIDTSAYACSKAGVWMLTSVLAREVVQDDINVNELIPGPVKMTIRVDKDP